MRIPLQWRLRISFGPAAQQERPKRYGTRKNQNAKTDAGANCLGVDPLHSDAYKSNGKDDSEPYIQRQRIDQQTSNPFKHVSPPSARRHPSCGEPAPRKATTPVRQHLSAAAIWRNGIIGFRNCSAPGESTHDMSENIERADARCHGLDSF